VTVGCRKVDEAKGKYERVKLSMCCFLRLKSTEEKSEEEENDKWRMHEDEWSKVWMRKEKKQIKDKYI
jgi:hypothetical protein